MMIRANTRVQAHLDRPKSSTRCPPCIPSSRSSHSSTVTPQAARRDVLLGLTASGWLLQELAAKAITYSGQQCVQQETEQEGDDCRRAGLIADAKSQEKYSDVSNKKLAVAGNVPVATLDKAYTVATLQLVDDIQRYTTMDVYEKDRAQFIKQLKQDGLKWVSSYARGGSARSQSARSMYIAIDAVLGHLASYGLAPLPGRKAQTVLAKVDAAKQFLTEGR